jgi:hypothetical protein
MQEMCRKAYRKKHPTADRNQEERDLALHFKAIEDALYGGGNESFGSSTVFNWKYINMHR